MSIPYRTGYACRPVYASVSGAQLHSEQYEVTDDIGEVVRGRERPIRRSAARPQAGDSGLRIDELSAGRGRSFQAALSAVRSPGAWASRSTPSAYAAIRRLEQISPPKSPVAWVRAFEIMSSGALGVPPGGSLCQRAGRAAGFRRRVVEAVTVNVPRPAQAHFASTYRWAECFHCGVSEVTARCGVWVDRARFGTASMRAIVVGALEPAQFSAVLVLTVRAAARRFRAQCAGCGR